MMQLHQCCTAAAAAVSQSLAARPALSSRAGCGHAWGAYAGPRGQAAPYHAHGAELAGATAVLLCRAGSYSKGDEWYQKGNCSPCDAGTYQPEPGKSE